MTDVKELDSKIKNTSILKKVKDELSWKEFIDNKINAGNLSREEEKELTSFVLEKRYLYYYGLIENGEFPADYPTKSIINKVGTNKKRVIYSYDRETNIVLKFIAYNMYVYDEIFNRSCYSFRRAYGVRNAIGRLKKNKNFKEKYCFKADISNYFNSINVDILLDKLTFIKQSDSVLFNLFQRMLKDDWVYDKGELIKEAQGAMAGMPCSTFFANVYLSDVDNYFEGMAKDVEYFRYSDDILIFADTKEILDKYIDIFKVLIKEKGLEINESKVAYINPGEKVEFLGFAYKNGIIDISDNTKRKLKAKIKRKAEALRRWARKKELEPDKAAKGFIKTMNVKFFGRYKDAIIDCIDLKQDFTWSRWFFPNITVDSSLEEIDKYMQQYIRYIITGRHYKGNYKITYEQMKDWGYRSLVHEYYKWRNHSGW